MVTKLKGELPCDYQVVIRMPRAMVERIDLMVDRIKMETPVWERAKVCRADAVRRVLDHALPPLPAIPERMG